MAETKHTPGPWREMHDAVLRKRAFGEECPGITIASAANTEPICRVSGYCQPLEANANLIAAAPEMYEALNKLRTLAAYLHGAPPHSGLITEIQRTTEAAIAKADGHNTPCSACGDETCAHGA